MTMQGQLAMHAMDDQADPTIRRMEYQALIARLRERVPSLVPAGSQILVVSRGDEELLRFGGMRAGHFPQADDGRYAGHYPADSQAAVVQLEALRAQGAEYLLFPRPALWWLDYYEGLQRHLEEQYLQLHRDADFALFRLAASIDESSRVGAADMVQAARWQQIASLLNAVLPEGASLIVVTGEAYAIPELGRREVRHMVVSAQGGKPVAADGQPISFALRDAVRVGFRYALLPTSQDDPAIDSVLPAIRSRYRLILHQANLCTIFETVPVRRTAIHQLRGASLASVSSPRISQKRGPRAEA